ncbi:MAG TPA: metalloregulator ArsR/SmtB family transcription factor [candidate division Zixibacteria bacterium]|jgi:ArsR family transcriptional regulator
MAQGKTQTEDLPPALKALSDPTRLKIMLMLEVRQRTVGEVVDMFGLSQPTITRHLQQLAQVKLIRRRKEAQRVIYEIDPDTVRCVCVELASCFPGCCMMVEVKPETVRSAPERKPRPGIKRRDQQFTPTSRRRRDRSKG